MYSQTVRLYYGDFYGNFSPTAIPYRYGSHREQKENRQYAYTPLLSECHPEKIFKTCHASILYLHKYSESRAQNIKLA